MKPSLYAATAISALFAGTLSAQADVPRVATDIAPVHSLVARVMKGVGEPDMIMQPGASPHGYSMRPSEALALDRSDIVFWVGDALTPWLATSLETLATDAHKIELLHVKGVIEREFREGATFEAHDHDDHDDHEGHDDHNEHAGHEDHDDHEGHGHDDHDHDVHDNHDDNSHDAHAESDHDDHHGHDHSGVDPHAWLAPENAVIWLEVIAEELAEHDPANAAAYAANASAGKAEIEAVVAELQATLEPFRAVNFVVFHDAYQYFEQSFGLSAAGAISLGDASDPSPARIAEIQQTVKDLGVTCVFSEPQFNPGLVETVMSGSDAKTVVLDPIGADIDAGPDFYTTLLKSIGQSMASCMQP